MCGVGGDLPGIAALHKEFKLPANRDYKLKIGLEIEQKKQSSEAKQLQSEPIDINIPIINI